MCLISYLERIGRCQLITARKSKPLSVVTAARPLPRKQSRPWQ
jgi:hypothetical protein